MPLGIANRRREHVGLHLIRQHVITRRCLPDGLVMRDVEVVELRAVVVADEPRHLLEVLRLELDDRRRAEAVRLLPPRDERLAELAADRLATVETQVTRAARVRLKSSSGHGERSH